MMTPIISPKFASITVVSDSQGEAIKTVPSIIFKNDQYNNICSRLQHEEDGFSTVALSQIGAYINGEVVPMVVVLGQALLQHGASSSVKLSDVQQLPKHDYCEGAETPNDAKKVVQQFFSQAIAFFPGKENSLGALSLKNTFNAEQNTFGNFLLAPHPLSFKDLVFSRTDKEDEIRLDLIV